MTNGSCSAPGSSVTPLPHSQKIGRLLMSRDPASPSGSSIAFSIAEKWLISHEDESGEDSQQRAAREVLH